MACETAVVASAVGGIPEVVDDGVTGLLVPYDERDPAEFEAGLADAVNARVRRPGARTADGAGRPRARGAASSAGTRSPRRTVELYQSLLR